MVKPTDWSVMDNFYIKDIMDAMAECGCTDTDINKAFDTDDYDFQDGSVNDYVYGY